MSWLSRLLDSRVTGLLGVYVFTPLDNAHLVALGENYFFHKLFFLMVLDLQKKQGEAQSSCLPVDPVSDRVAHCSLWFT